jgi:hypothetical protein
MIFQDLKFSIFMSGGLFYGVTTNLAILLPGNDRETNNKSTAIAMLQLRKYATVLELHSGLRVTMEVLLEEVFSMWSVPRLYHSTDLVQFS